MSSLLLIQLPDDVINQGYKQTRPFHYEQVFYSPGHEFTGTEREFLKAGIAYQYRQIDAFTRYCISYS